MKDESKVIKIITYPLSTDVEVTSGCLGKSYIGPEDGLRDFFSTIIHRAIEAYRENNPDDSAYEPFTIDLSDAHPTRRVKILKKVLGF